MSAEAVAERAGRHSGARLPPFALPERLQLGLDETFTVWSSISWPFWIA